MALVLSSLEDVARERGNEDRAGALYNDALALRRELGNERGWLAREGVSPQGSSGPGPEGPYGADLGGRCCTLLQAAGSVPTC